MYSPEVPSIIMLMRGRTQPVIPHFFALVNSCFSSPCPAPNDNTYPMATVRQASGNQSANIQDTQKSQGKQDFGSDFLKTAFNFAKSAKVVPGQIPSSPEIVTFFSSPVLGSTNCHADITIHHIRHVRFIDFTYTGN